LTLLTDASVIVRVGALAFVAGVVPIALNRVFGGSAADPAAGAAASDEPTDDAGSESGDEPTG